ncbi:MAG: hypothetical protein FJ135_05100 [Deltaproteobacteria bacterium]|nr:hypothetical protein [Deltaproteobacteria bacterium]
MPDCPLTRTAVFDGQFFDATNGKTILGKNFAARTMWGWIAWSLGGACPAMSSCGNRMNTG